jgi:hypothetical protein
MAGRLIEDPQDGCEYVFLGGWMEGDPYYDLPGGTFRAFSDVNDVEIVHYKRRQSRFTLTPQQEAAFKAMRADDPGE